MPAERPPRNPVLALLMLGMCFAMVALVFRVLTSDPRRIAITFDDLPWTSLADAGRRAPPPDMMVYHQQLMAALRDSGAPATGFVNEDKLEAGGRLLPERLGMLGDWLDAGAELGNHTFAHADLHAVGLSAYQADILKGERQLRPLLAQRGKTPSWFRPPYLRAGRSVEDKHGLGTFLDAQGYRLAPVTVDNADWVWARAYRNLLDENGGEVSLERLRSEYVRYLLARVDYYERNSRDLLGYALPQILVIHANEINAVTYPALVEGLRDRGYQIVSLEEAMQDPAYARADPYTGPWGPSWLHRWARDEGQPPAFFAGAPVSPDWVLAWAGMEAED